MKPKDYKIIKCPYCGAESYDFNAQKTRTIGNPRFKCPSCGKTSFRKNIAEAAFLDPESCFALRYSYEYFLLRILIIVFYAVFLGFIIIEQNVKISIYFAVIAVLLYLIYLLARTIHKKKFLDSHEYKKLVDESMERLSDEKYVKIILQNQKPEKRCPYLQERKDET
jgi:endogenous inhibitor of DNA gyrase (YacG/DUF329 family)